MSEETRETLEELHARTDEELLRRILDKLTGSDELQPAVSAFNSSI